MKAINLYQMLEHFQNNKSATARWLNMHRLTLTKHIKNDTILVVDDMVYVRVGYTRGPMEEYGKYARYNRTKYLNLAREVYASVGYIPDAAKVLGEISDDVEEWEHQLYKWKAEGKLFIHE